MHRTLLIPEILLNIMGRCPLQTDVATLARTCRAFKEPALDTLWAELPDLSPLARCLPNACCSSDKCYAFHRPLNATDWNTLRGYACRVRYIRQLSSFFGSLDPSAMREIFTLAPSGDPLFPKLRSMLWADFTILPVAHIAVGTLTSISFYYSDSPVNVPAVTEFIDAFGERCPNMKSIQVCSPYPYPDPLDAAIFRQVCRWKNLQRVACQNVALSLQAILHLSCVSTLEFTLSANWDYSGPVLLFPNLTYLEIISCSAESIVRFFSHIQLPVIDHLIVAFPNDASKTDIQEFQATVQKACPSESLTRLMFYSPTEDLDDLEPEFDEHGHPHLSLEDLSYKAFSELRTIYINFARPVQLTDSDLLDLVSAWPQLLTLMINDTWGWRTDDGEGGITLSGLVQLLRRCPSLYRASLAINTQTFTHIPDGLDVSFLPRRSLHVDLLDSYIERAFVPGLVSVFRALGLSFSASVEGARDFEEEEEMKAVWNLVSRGTYNEM